MCIIKNKGLIIDNKKNRGDFVIHFLINNVETDEFKQKVIDI